MSWTKTTMPSLLDLIQEVPRINTNIVQINTKNVQGNANEFYKDISEYEDDYGMQKYAFLYRILL